MTLDRADQRARARRQRGHTRQAEVQGGRRWPDGQHEDRPTCSSSATAAGRSSGRRPRRFPTTWTSSSSRSSHSLSRARKQHWAAAAIITWRRPPSTRLAPLDGTRPLRCPAAQQGFADQPHKLPNTGRTPTRTEQSWHKYPVQFGQVRKGKLPRLTGDGTGDGRASTRSVLSRRPGYSGAWRRETASVSLRCLGATARRPGPRSWCPRREAWTSITTGLTAVADRLHLQALGRAWP